MTDVITPEPSSKKTMRSRLSRGFPIFTLAIILLLAWLGSVMLSNYVTPKAPDFSYNTTSERSLRILGVNSSGLRLTAGFVLDTNQVNPTYKKGSITVVNSFTNLKSRELTADEEKATIDSISSVAPAGTQIIDDSVAFSQKGVVTTRVPVKVVFFRNPDTKAYEAIASRVLNNESVALTIRVSSPERQLTENALTDALNNVQLVESESSY